MEKNKTKYTNVDPKKIQILKDECSRSKELKLMMDHDVKIIGRGYKAIKTIPSDISSFTPSLVCLQTLDDVFKKDNLIVEGRLSDLLYGVYVGVEPIFQGATKEVIQRMVLSGINGLWSMGYLSFIDNYGIILPSIEVAININAWVQYTPKILGLFDFTPTSII